MPWSYGRGNTRRNMKENELQQRVRTPDSAARSLHGSRFAGELAPIFRKEGRDYLPLLTQQHWVHDGKSNRGPPRCQILG